LLYLNDDFEGGQTDFPTWKLTVIPQTGSIISWRNMKENGELEKDSLHAGLPVTKGVKYILIVWVREHAYKVIR
jgi:prolyl 4-hydroxylase